jgi:hypothetical protein
MTTFLILIGTAFIVFILLFLFAPTKYEIHKTVIIEKPLPEVFEFISSLKNNEFWSPWHKKDLKMKKTYIGTDKEEGFIAAWKGNDKVGEGELEIVKIVPNREIITQIRIFKPFKNTSDSYLKVFEEDENTEVIWGYRGIFNRPMNVLAFFMRVNERMGKDYEKGLLHLKYYLED